VPTYEEYSQWLDATTEKVVEKLQARIEHHRLYPKGGRSAPDIGQQNRKFDHIESLIIEHREHSEAKRSVLSRTIRGFLTEFIRQSETKTVLCNIEHGNRQARLYWDEQERQSPGSFRNAILSGQFHTAAAYNKQLALSGERVNSGEKRVGKSPLFHSIGEVIRSTIDVFKEEYAMLRPGETPMPSLHNDHMAVIEMAYDLRGMRPRELCK